MSDTSVVTLVEFLLACIAADEQCAAAALDQPLGYRWRSLSWLTEANRDHGQRHDPGRVLAECEAKRQIVEIHMAYDCTAAGEAGHETCGDREWCYNCGEHDKWPCPTLRVLALPYADHPDYRQEFRP